MTRDVMMNVAAMVATAGEDWANAVSLCALCLRSLGAWTICARVKA
jgi:hypothetical protein